MMHQKTKQKHMCKVYGVFLGPVTCNASISVLTYPGTFITNSTAYSDCTALDTFISTVLEPSALFFYCQSGYSSYGFRQGIHGQIPPTVDSIHAQSCSRGDYRMWFIMEMCCPGNILNGLLKASGSTWILNVRICVGTEYFSM